MPRIIEPVIGKVVGPLRMKVPHALAKSNDSKDHTCSHRSDTVPNQNDRRGRYSRNRGNMRKLRSKSLPQSSNSSILLGKPPESDDPFHVDLPTPKAGSMKKRAFKASKNSSKQNDMGSFGVFDCDDSNEDASNATDLNPISSLPAKRRALALDTRYLVSKVDVIEKAQCWESTFIRHCKDFLRTLDCREAAPSILAVSKTIGSGSSTRGNPAMAALGIETEAFNLVKGLDRTIIDKAIDVSDRSIISGIPVRTTKSSGVAMPIPIACQAKSSWLLFSSLGTSQFMLQLVVFHIFVSQVNMLRQWTRSWWKTVCVQGLSHPINYIKIVRPYRSQFYAQMHRCSVIQISIRTRIISKIF
jgi:hypothetical protein